MPNRHRLPYAALGGYLAVFLGVSLALAQGDAPENIPKLAPTIEKGQGVAVKAVPPESKAAEKPSGQKAPAAKPAPTAPVKNKRPTKPSCDARCQAAEQREKADLKAQQSMADSADGLLFLTWWQFWAGVVGISLLFYTLHLTRQANKAAIRAADAAEKTAEIAADTARHQLCAFVFGKGFEQGLSIWDGAIREYVVFVKWENSGLTPATDVQSWIKFETFPMNEDREVTFFKTGNEVSTVLGPHSTTQSGFLTIPLQTVMEKWQQQTEIQVWARIEYRDIFDPKVVHHHEQCAILQVIHDPSEIPPKGHPPYVIFNIFGPQNTTS